MIRHRPHDLTGMLLLAMLSLAGMACGSLTPGASAGGIDSALSAPEPFDSTTTVRYLQTGRALARAVATGDSVAFRALYADSAWVAADDWTRAMLVNQKRKFGPVVSGHGLFRGVLRMGQKGLGLPPRGAAILLRFQQGGGASMSFTVAEDGRITTSSLWVALELADVSNEGAELLWPTPERSVLK